MKRIISLVVLLMALVACTDLSDVESRLDSLEQRVDGLEAAVAALRKAYDEGRIITAVMRSADGWLITFSDESTIDLVNGRDGADGKDGRDGTDGADGRDGIDGINGKDGRDGTDGKDGRAL